MPSITFEVSPRLTPKDSLPDSNGWKGRHLRYCRVHPVAIMIIALDAYERSYRERFDQPIWEDFYLSPAFYDALKAVRTLLNGEIGGLDGGTCDAAILGIFRDAGFEGEL
jgi:hypothetical protein